MGLFDPKADPNFNVNHPPLLKDLGVGTIASLLSVYGDTATYDAGYGAVLVNGNQVFDMNALAAAGWSFPNVPKDGSGNYSLQGSAKVQKVWKLIDPPVVTGAPQKISFTEYYESSVSTLSTFRALLSATVSGGFGPVSASVTAEVEATISSEQKFISGGSKSVEISVPGDTAAATWEQMQICQISYSIPVILAKMPGLSFPIPLTIGGITSYSLLVSEYNDFCPTSDLPQTMEFA